MKWLKVYFPMYIVTMLGAGLADFLFDGTVLSFFDKAYWTLFGIIVASMVNLQYKIKLPD